MSTSRRGDRTVPGFTGEAIYPDTAGYDKLRRVFNGLIDKRPSVMLYCRSRDDIVAAVRYAVGSGAEIAVRGGGHGVAGHACTDGGVVIDVSLMREVRVDAERRIAFVGPGATWGDVDRATVRHGLSCPGGVVSTTGVSGFTLGGGIGWLSRAYGLACDNLVGAELVTADAEVLSVSESQHADVLWGLRGGGGNFGVVAGFVLRLHQLSRVGGAIRSYDDTEADAVLNHFRARMNDAPDHLAAILGFSTELDSGRPQVDIMACSTRTDEIGQSDLRALLDVAGTSAEPVSTQQGRMLYPTWQQGIDETARFGWLNCWKSVYVQELSDEAIRRIALLGRARPAPQTRLHLIRLGGAASRVAPDATAVATRDQPYIIHLMTTWDEPDDTERCMAWADYAEEILRPLGPAGVYLNFVGEQGPERIRASFGDATYRRLATLKARLDPHNRFALNHNIEPAPNP